MNINDHIIQDMEIAGIGPLIVKFANSQIEQQLYGSYQYFFELHLKNHTTVISSDWISKRGYPDDIINKHTQYSEKWKTQYNNTKRKVLVQIGEIDDNKSTSTDNKVESLETAEKIITDNLNKLLDMVSPKSLTADGVNNQVNRILSSIADLKNIACRSLTT